MRTRKRTRRRKLVLVEGHLVLPIPKHLRDNDELNRRPTPLIGPRWRRLLCWLGVAHRDFLLWHTGPEIWVGVQTGHWPKPTVFCGWCGRSKVLPRNPVQQSVQHEPSLRSATK